MEEIIKNINYTNYFNDISNLIENNGTNINQIIIIIIVLILFNVLHSLYKLVSRMMLLYIILIIIMRFYVTYLVLTENNYEQSGALMNYNPIYNSLEIKQLYIYKSVETYTTQMHNLINNKLFFDITYHLMPLKIYNK